MPSYPFLINVVKIQADTFFSLARNIFAVAKKVRKQVTLPYFIMRQIVRPNLHEG